MAASTFYNVDMEYVNNFGKYYACKGINFYSAAECFHSKNTVGEKSHESVTFKEAKCTVHVATEEAIFL